MLKFVLLIFIVQILPGDVLRLNTEAYDKNSHHGKGEITGDIKAESSTRDFVELDEREKFHKKKWKVLDKKYVYEVRDKPYKKENKFKEHKKIQGTEWEVFENANEFDAQSRGNRKRINNYEKRQNDYENPQKIKDVNYHDKHGVANEKERFRKEREVYDLPLSLHHDIDVNYLGPHRDLTNDAEFVDLENVIGGNEKRENYVQSNSESNYKKMLSDKKPKNDFYKNLKKFDPSTVSFTNNSAMVARYIIHTVDWTSISTLSTNAKLKGGPFANIISVSDGPINEGSGVPFFYMTPKDFTSIDLNKDNRCTIAATLAETDHCKTKHIDPESPLCARLILSGKIKKIKTGTEEESFAKQSLFSRHPEMESWPADHNWYFAKLKIHNIIVIDHFGGASYVTTKDYFNV